MKNKLTVTRGGRGITGERRGRVKPRNKYKEQMDNDNGGAEIECERGDMGRAGESNGGKMEKKEVNNNYIIKKEKENQANSCFRTEPRWS